MTESWSFKLGENGLDGSIVNESGGYIAGVQWRGNGPLLAAAPLMLDALRLIANHVDSILNREPVDGRLSLFAADRNALEMRLSSTREAIRAATGEES